MRIKPFQDRGSTVPRRYYWDEITECVNGLQKIAGRNVLIHEHAGIGTVLDIHRCCQGTPVTATGACCYGFWPGLFCEEVTAAQCAIDGGHYNGDGTTCGTTDCGSGACCETDGGCSDTFDFLCGDCTVGATSCWMGYGSTCATTRCEGACCCFGCDQAGCIGETLTYDECQAACPFPPCGASNWLLAGDCATAGCA